VTGFDPITTFDHSCQLSPANTIYWNISEDNTYITVRVIHNATYTTNQDWIGVGLVSATKTTMVGNQVFLYKANDAAIPFSYEYLITGYSASSFLPVTNVVEAEHQGVKAVWTVDNSVLMEFEYSVFAGASSTDDATRKDVELNLNLGNRLIFASGPAWPRVHRQYGLTDIDWQMGTCTPI